MTPNLKPLKSKSKPKPVTIKQKSQTQLDICSKDSFLLEKNPKRLDLDYYQIDALDLAPRLLGKYLRRDDVVLQITEVEAYRSNDSACHGRVGVTSRTAPLFGPGGHAYVYLCYGMHNMLNVVADKEGIGLAVLIRSCAPVTGLETIKQGRGLDTDKPVLTGPGKVGQALGISKDWSNHAPFTPGGLELLDGPEVKEIVVGPRVGSSDERKVVSSMSPDICIVNFYTKSGRFGLHQDKDESKKSLKKGLRPIVSFSIGDSAEFIYGETRAIDEADKVILESGDVLICGGESRFIYHGVTSIFPDTAPTSLIEATNMCPGRLNLTFRMSKEYDNARLSHPVFESAVKDVTFDVKNLKLTPFLLDADDGNFKKVEQFGDKSENDDDNARLCHPVFDICPKRISSVLKLKAPLHVVNKEKQNQISIKGQNIVVLGPGMVLMKDYISSADQISIVKTCRDLGVGFGGFYQPRYSCGKKLHLQMMCIGKNWDPESHMYTELRPFDKSKPLVIPEKFRDMVKKAIQDSNEFIWENTSSSDQGKVVPYMSPDICIVKFYNKSGRLGFHQHNDAQRESRRASGDFPILCVRATPPEGEPENSGDFSVFVRIVRRRQTEKRRADDRKKQIIS